MRKIPALACILFLVTPLFFSQVLSARKKAAKPQSSEVVKTTVKPKEPTKNTKPKKKPESMLKHDEKQAKWIETTLKYGINKDRRNALNSILSIKNPSIKKRMKGLVVDVLKTETESEVLAKALNVAGELQMKEAEPYCIRALDNESNDVRIESVNVLRRIRAKSAIPHLIKKLESQDMDQDSNFTQALINTLADLKATGLREFAEKTIRDVKTTRGIRLQMVLFLGKIGNAGQIPLLIQLLQDEEEESDVRAYAANSLAHLGAKDAAKELDAVIRKIEAYPYNKKKEHYNLYIYCIAALARLGDNRAMPRLMNSLKSDNPSVRMKAVKLMGELKDKRTIDILKYKRDHDPDRRVQKAARRVLEDMGIKN